MKPVRGQVDDQVYVRVWWPLNNQVRGQVKDQVREQVYLQVVWQVWWQVKEDIT